MYSYGYSHRVDGCVDPLPRFKSATEKSENTAQWPRPLTVHRHGTSETWPGGANLLPLDLKSLESSGSGQEATRRTRVFDDAILRKM